MFKVDQFILEDASQLATLFFDSFSNDVTFQALLLDGVTDEVRQHIQDWRTKAIGNNAPDSYELGAREVETGNIASEIGYKIEHQKADDSYDKFEARPFPSGFDKEGWLRLLQEEWEKRLQIMGRDSFLHLTRLRSSPKYGRKGAASLLIRETIAHAERLDLPIYLASSPAGKALYTKFGFEQVDTFSYGIPNVPVEAQTGACMIRPSKSRPNIVTEKRALATKAMTSSIEIRPVPEPTVEFMLHVVRLMDTAFADMPVLIQQLFGSNTQDTPAQRAEKEFNIVKGKPEIYEYDIAVDTATEEIVGIAKWFQVDDPKVEQFPMGIPTTISTGANLELLDAFFGELHRRQVQIMAEKGNRYTELALLVIDPNQQRRGIGGKLLKTGLARIESRNEEAYVSASPAGLGLYKKYGWEEAASVKVDLAEFGDEGEGTVVGLVRKPGASLG